MDEKTLDRLWSKFRPIVAPMFVLRREFFRHTARNPSAIVLPSHLIEAAGGEYTTVMGLPVIWDDRPEAVPGLVYSAK